MKRFLTSLAIAFMCGVLVTPVIEARDSRSSRTSVSGGGRAGRSSNTGSSSRQSRSSNNGGGTRPTTGSGNNSGHNNSGVRPGNNPSPGNNSGHNNSGVRPGSNPNPGGVRPAPGTTRPGHNDVYRPGGHTPTPPRPVTSGHLRPGTPPPPPVAHRPVARPWNRPVPPRSWRPAPRAPRFSTILGVALGTAFSNSLTALINSGYNVASYGNDVVYLNNVNQLNFLWPQATLYYNNGGLARGEFIYYTPGYDTYRYNNVYSSLVANYGAPINSTHLNNGMQTTWFGADGRFVTLEYAPSYGNDGIMRYYTTLSFGY